MTPDRGPRFLARRGLVDGVFARHWRNNLLGYSRTLRILDRRVTQNLGRIVSLYCPY